MINYHDERLHSTGSSYISEHSVTLCTHSVLQLYMYAYNSNHECLYKILLCISQSLNSARLIAVLE